MKKEEIKKEAWRIIEIFIEAKENFNFCYYFYKPQTQEEIEYVAKDSHLKFIRHSLWRLCVIDLSKLFSNKKNDEFRLVHFISKLKPTGYYSEFCISSLKIDEWEKILSQESNLITNINTLRDKVYAHTDMDKDNYRDTTIYFEEVKKLFDLVESILKEVYSICFDAFLDLETPVSGRGDMYLVKDLANEHRRQIEEILKPLNKPYGG